MTHIAFLITFEKNPYSGVVRPFINWAKYLENSTIILFRCGKELIDKVGANNVILNSTSEIIDYIKRERQRHKSSWTVKDFKKRGYKIHGFGLKIHPKNLMLWGGVRYFFTPISFLFPRISEGLIGTKSFGD